MVFDKLDNRNRPLFTAFAGWAGYNSDRERENMDHNFFSMVFRMKYIDRWGLMRNTWKESLSEHTLDVAVLSHALAVIARKRLGKQVDAQRAVMIALFHDTSEIITGDLPTPVKYYNDSLITAYKQVEQVASNQLLQMLPEDFREEYQDYFFPGEDDRYLCHLVKGADKLSALIKCIEEENAGNREFVVAKEAQLKALHAMEMMEIELFIEEFLPGFSKTLDEQ